MEGCTYLDTHVLHPGVEGCTVLFTIHQNLVAAHPQVRVTLDTRPADVSKHMTCGVNGLVSLYSHVVVKQQWSEQHGMVNVKKVCSY